jgi:thiamine-monophosphate kinase
MMTGETGEFELIDRLRERLRGAGLPIGPGDDAAVLPPSIGPVVTVDTSVEGIHFPCGWDDPAGIARRALAVALSDLAAMGAEAGQVLVALGTTPDREAEFWFSLADSMVEATGEFGVDLAGGDVVASPLLFLSVTALGSIPDGQAPVTRAGASPGDLVAVTGCFGGARMGLLLHERSVYEAVPGVDPDPRMAPLTEARRLLLERYLGPVPRLAAGVAFGRHGASAMIDVSDGLLADLGHLARESGVRIELAEGSIPVDPLLEPIREDFGGADLTPLALTGGDDYELALTFPPDRLDDFRQAATGSGVDLTVIGSVVEGEGVSLPTELENPRSGLFRDPGFEHRF